MKKEIILKEIRLLNFKGARSLSIEFDRETRIYGDNSTGKSTIFDAFLWLLFGKDAADRKDFEIKTLDSNNNVIPKIDHEVSAVILVNGKPIELKRILREKWQKPRGAEEPVFNGNETLYYWNDVPLKAGEYQDKIKDILDEEIFKLITNPMAFDNLKWQDRRAILTSMCPLSNEEIGAGNSNFDFLRNLNDTEVQEEKKRVSARRKKLNDDLKTIPTRIDEVQRSKPIPLRFDKIREQIAEKDAALKDVEAKISNKSKAVEDLLNKKSEQQKEIHRIKSFLTEIEHEEKQVAKAATRIDYTDRDHLSRQVSAKDRELNEAHQLLTQLKGKISTTEGEIEKKRAQWREVNSKELTFNDNDFHCPTCKREFEEGDVEAKKAEMQKNFNLDKKKKLENIDAEGGELAATLKNLQERKAKGEELVSKLEPELAELQKSLESENTRLKALEVKTSGEPNIDEALQSNEKYQEYKTQLAKLESNLVEVPEVDTKNLEFQKQQIQQDLDKLKEDLSIEQVIKKADERITELAEQEKNLSQQVMELEKQEFAIESFERLKIETLESMINSRFRYVNFKLFSEQINGGIAETCEALIDGVPFSNANTASRINAGLDIINSLSEYYEATAPIFIDNRESVVNLIDTDSQIINLFVEEGALLSVGKPKYTPEHLAKLEKLQKQVA